MTVKYVLVTFLIGFAFSLVLSILASIKAFKGDNEKSSAFSIAAIIVNAAFLCADLYLIWYNANYN